MDPSTNVASNNNGTSSNRTNKKTADTDLKSSIIEFMRVRPFLWNSKHPNYKDHKRREEEFQAFSTQLDCPVKEIKRVWHVLRTNFFRAHKLIIERPQNNGENGDKLWKYYLAMDYILEGAQNEDQKDVRSTRSSRSARDTRGGLKLEKETVNNANKNCSSLNCSNGSNLSSRVVNNTSPSANSSSFSESPTNPRKPTNTSCQHRNTLSSEISLEADDDHLYARSLTSTLKRFDPTTKEIIKLKFQEIIVNYMQQKDAPSSHEPPGSTPDLSAMNTR